MKHAWKTLQVDKNLFGNREEKKPLERIILKYIKNIYKDNIKMYMEVGKCDDIDWIYLAYDMVHCGEHGD